MEIIRYRVPKTWELVMLGDSQEGNTLQYTKGFLEAIQYVMDGPRRCAIHMGDAVEGFYIDDKRYTPATMKADPLSSAKTFISQCKELAKARKLITVLFGNHELDLFKKAGNITRHICDELGIPYGGGACVVTFAGPDAKTQFKGYFRHGKKPIRSVADDPIRRLANEKLQLKQHLKYKVGDCLLLCKGHTHKLIIAEPYETLYLTTEGNDIKEHYTKSSDQGGDYIHPDARWYVNTGSFLKSIGIGVDSYSELAEYDPIQIGYAVATIEDGQLVNIRKVLL